MSDSDNYQVGVHDIDTSGTIAEESDVIEFEVETEAVFKRLADDIYETAEAGIREPLMNAITSVRRAFDGDLSEGVIEITVKDGDQVTVQLRDNGIGITEDVLENVLTVIGRSGVRDDGQLAGQYGIGFLASYKLVGSDGGFFMHTNPRDGKSHKGMFRPGAFEPDTDDKLPSILGDEYGTAFEYHVKESISRTKIREWVEKHAHHSPISVIYKEFDSDGDEIYNEDFGGKSLSESYQTRLKFENEYLEAVASPESRDETVLISSPMKMYNRSEMWDNLPWKVDLRLKYENGVVIDGPHEGLAPVTAEEYNTMDRSRRDDYIPEKQLNSSDILLPQPIGTREKLDADKDFLKYVNEKIVSKLKENIQYICKNFNPSDDSYDDLDQDKQASINAIADATQSESLRSFINKTSIKSKKRRSERLTSKLNSICESVSVDADDEIVEFVSRMSEKLSSTIPADTERKMLCQHVNDNKYDETFVSVSSSSWKSDAVRKSPLDVRLISVPKSSWYDSMKDYFSWKPLKTLDSSKAKRKLDLSKSEIEGLRGAVTGNKKVEEKTVKIRMTKRESQTVKSEKIRTECKSTVPYKRSDYLLLFPRGAEKNISNNKDLCQMTVSIASCSQDVYDYLTEDRRNILHYEDYKNVIGDTGLATSDGEKTISDITDYENVILLPILEYASPDEISREDVLDSLCRQACEKRELEVSESVVVATEPYGWNHLRTLDELDSVFSNLMSLDTPRDRSYNFRSKYSKLAIDLLNAYCRDTLSEEQINKGVLDVVKAKYREFNEESVSFVDKISKSAELKKQSTTSSSKSLPKHQTEEGLMDIKQIYDKYDAGNVLIHVVSPEFIDPFQEIGFIEDANSNLAGQKLITDKFRVPSNVFYVPVVPSAYNKIDELISGRSNVIGFTSTENRRRGSSNEHWYNSCIYAGVKLHEWSNDSVSNLVKDLRLNQSVKLVDELTALHNNGGEPPKTNDISKGRGFY